MEDNKPPKDGSLGSRHVSVSSWKGWDNLMLDDAFGLVGCMEVVD